MHTPFSKEVIDKCHAKFDIFIFAFLECSLASFCVRLKEMLILDKLWQKDSNFFIEMDRLLSPPQFDQFSHFFPVFTVHIMWYHLDRVCN